jgi:hypothetical protein
MLPFDRLTILAVISGSLPKRLEQGGIVLSKSTHGKTDRLINETHL